MVIKVKRIEKIINNKVFKGIAVGLKAITSTLIIIVISIIFIQRVSDNKVTLFGYSMFTIVSESMVPKYEIRDMVIAKKVVAEDIKIGDDVVYLGEESNLNGKIVTHQVIKKEYKNGKYIFNESRNIAKKTGIVTAAVSATVNGVKVYKGKESGKEATVNVAKDSAIGYISSGVGCAVDNVVTIAIAGTPAAPLSKPIGGAAGLGTSLAVTAVAEKVTASVERKMLRE